MGPEPESSGKHLGVIDKADGLTDFNGAGAGKLRKTVRELIVKHSKPNFNGAGAGKLRKTVNIFVIHTSSL